MARASMAALISRARILISDPAGASQVFADDAIQDLFDERRTEVFEAQLAPAPTTVIGPVVSYLDYMAPRGCWEDSVVLKDGLNAVITPVTSDLIRGHWTFSANQVPPVFITGNYYDLYGTAVSLLEVWQAIVALEFDFAVDNQTFDRTGKRQGLAALAESYRRRAIPPGKRPDWRAIYW